jgi:hypothetical protein
MDFDIEMDDVPVDAAPIVEDYTTDIVVGEEQVTPHSDLIDTLGSNGGSRPGTR